jgi:hypothetical protein
MWTLVRLQERCRLFRSYQYRLQSMSILSNLLWSTRDPVLGLRLLHPS